MRSWLLWALLLVAGTCRAEWPERPVRMVLPSPPGSSSDGIARVIAAHLSSRWKQPVIIDAKPGAGGVVASEAVARSAPDGYTLGWVITSHAVAPSLRPSLPYDTLADFSGVTLLYQAKAAIVAAPTVPASNVAELVQWIRAQPALVAYASSGTGTASHLLGEMFRMRHGLAMEHVGYRGTMQAYPDVIAGRVPVVFDLLSTALSQVRSGKVKLIAVLGDRPAASAPQAPLAPDLLPDGMLFGWNGIVVPARTPRAIVAKVNADLIEALRSPEVQEALQRYDVEAITCSPEAFDAFIRRDIARWGEVVRRAGVKLEEGS